MAEEETVPSLSEKDGIDISQSKDIYIPEEPTPDASVSLLDIQMPETPESNKGQTSDGDTSRLESPKMVKPVLGKVQAKKRLMAFANQFKVLPKSQVKSHLSQYSTGVLKTKDKMVQDDTNSKSRKKTEEKILAIEEIRREESKSKMLLAEAMAAASMEDENHTGRNDLLEGTRHSKEKIRHEDINDSHKNRSTMDRKYLERHRHRDKIDKDNSNREVKDRNVSNTDCSTRKSQDGEKRKKDKKKKDNKDKRHNSKTEAYRDKREEEKDKKENEKEKREETREKKEGIKSNKENIKDKRNDMSEMEVEGKNKKEKDKDRWKEKELLKCNSWAELRKSGLTLDDITHLRKRDNSERSVRNRTTQDYVRYFEQMLMLNNYHLKRQALVAEGLDGPKKYPPESIKMTKRTRGSQLLYCENPRVSLLLRISQLLQAVTPERRERIRDICEASSPRIDTEDVENTASKRNWYQQINAIKYPKDTKWQMTVQLPRSKWDSEDEETSSASVAKEEIEKSANKLHISMNQQERCSTSSCVTDEDKITNTEKIKRDNESNEKIIDNMMTNDEASISPLLQSAGNEKLASEYEQFMKIVCTVTDVTMEYSPKKNLAKSASPHSYHEFNIESNLAEDNTNIEISLKEKFEKKEKIEILKESIKSTECEEESIDCQIHIDENNMQIEHKNNNDEDSKSIPSDWENVRIKVERLSDENAESREVKKKKKQKKITSSSDSSGSNNSSDSEKEKKKKKRKRKVQSNSSSDSDSTDSNSSNSSDSSSSDERKKKKRKKKVGKKRKKARRVARMKKKRRRKMSTDSSSNDSNEHSKKKKKIKKKTKETKQYDTKSINNGDISKIISKSSVTTSPSDGVIAIKKIKEETVTIENRKRATSTRKNIAGMNVHDNECVKQTGERKESKSDENFMEQWEMDSMIAMQQNDGDTSNQNHTGEFEKMNMSEKDKYRRKRKHSRENIELDKDGSCKVNEEKIHEGQERLDEEFEGKRKKRREKDIRSSSEFLTDWEREGERITQQIIQNEIKFSKKLGKQKKEKWEETDFNTLNVPSLTQLEKEVCHKQLLADEWEVDSLEAISDLTVSKRKSSQGTLKKVEKEVRYDKKTDTYIAIEKESAKEMKKRQERLCAIRIWEEEQEEGEREEMMLLEQKNKYKKDNWDIEEELFLRKNNGEIEVCKVNNIVGLEKEWNKPDEDMDTNIKEDSNKLMMKLEPINSKRVKKSRWDIGSQSEEKPEVKDIWEEEYVKWSKVSKCEQKLEKTNKGESRTVDYSESSTKSDLIDFYHRKSQDRESLKRSWTLEEIANRLVQTEKVEDTSAKNLIPAETDEEQIASNKKQHQNRDQFKEILGLDAKFKEKTIELYSPSSPAFSQKSQDAEASNDSNSSNFLPREERKTEMLIIAEALSIPTPIPLQLTKLHDSKHAANEQIGDILGKVQLKDKSSSQEFDIKRADNLFDNLSMNDLCPETHNSKLIHMDIFAEYGLEKSHNNQRATSSKVNSMARTKNDEMNEGKTTLKLIPKQLLIRRTNEQLKAKRILETPLQDPAQHAAALLTIQKKLLESHALKDDIKKSPNEEPMDQFKPRYNTTNNSETDKLLDTTEFAVASKSSVIAVRQSRSPASEKAVSVQFEQSENYDRENKNNNIKKCKAARDTNVSSGIRFSVRERKRSPSKKESEKRYSHDYSKDKKERKSDDVEKSDKKDNRSLKADFADNRRKSSPSGRGRRKRSRSPYAWERQKSASKSPGHSWSRSHSRSPKRKDETIIGTRDREKKRERYDDERLGRSKTDERRERYIRSPSRSGYNEDSFKKHSSVSSKVNRDDWNRKGHDSMDRDREKDVRSYDPMEMLRERTMESEKYRNDRFHSEELDRTFWQYENSHILRDGNESIDSYAAAQDLPLEYDDRSYYREGSLERDMIHCSPQSLSKYKRRFSARRERQWEKDKHSSDLDRHGHIVHRLRNRTPPRSRHSPMRQAPEQFRRKSRSRSRSWSRSRSRTQSRSRSGSRSRSTSRSRLRIRSRSGSRSRSPTDSRLRAKSTSMSRLRSPEHGFRMSELRSSRSPSIGRSRISEIRRETNDEDENRKFNICGDRGRRIETIVQSGITTGMSILDSEMSINSSMDAANFQYSNEIEGGNEYYYTENNLTYPPCIDESTTSSPKRLSLDDRLELELGIKKQHSKDSAGVSSEYSSNFNPNVITYPSPPQQQQQQMMYRQQPTVLQVGNVLQVVPADFNGIQSARREVSATPPVRPGSSQVVRVGNVLQVVPTSLDWSSGQSSTADQSSGVLYSPVVPAPSPSTSSVMSVPVPVPVPLPLPVPPALPIAANTLASVTNMSSAALPLSLPVPVPVPVPIPSTTVTAFPRNETQSQKIVQPVYNYEAILETRRKEREERKRLRELRRKEKERRKIERVNRRALRLLEKNNISQQADGVLLDHRKSSVVDPLVLKALKDGEEQTEVESANLIKEEEEAAAALVKEEDEDTAMDEDEDDDEDEVEAEAEDDEEEEEEAEDEDEDDDDDDEKPLQMINQRTEVNEAITPADVNKDQVEIETKKEWPELPPPPLKGILVAPGFRRDLISNGNLDNLSDTDDDIKNNSDKDEETDKNNECDRDTESDIKPSKLKLAELLKKTKRSKKSVQFADGIKPGEGTSPSGGEGDMPSPPPPKGISFREGLKDLRRDKIYSRKNRKQEKRTRPPKTKKKVKVKIIKLKKPRVTPLTAMMMDDSDELDDRSPPPPPPGSPPPPHLWPSYLSIYNTTVRAVEQPQTTTCILTSVQALPPPTPLPLLVPPPPLNYTIQPCNKS